MAAGNRRSLLKRNICCGILLEKPAGTRIRTGLRMLSAGTIEDCFMKTDKGLGREPETMDFVVPRRRGRYNG